MKTYTKTVYPFLTSAAPKDFTEVCEVQIPSFKFMYHHRIAIACNQGCNSNQLITEKCCE